jgi:alcohol dehydrogenase class IV
MRWDYKQPVTIRFGNGRLGEVIDIVKEHGWDNGLLVCTRHFVRSGLAERLTRQSGGAIAALFLDVHPNPTVQDVDACAALLRREGAGFVIALGGGSVLDCAKAAAALALTDDSVVKYHGTGVPVPMKRLPLIAVPTTSGTGSEVTSVSVLTDPDTGKKAPIVSDAFFPDFAVVDPLLTHSMSPYLTACTGADVLCHAVEGFWSRNHQPACDALALHATRLVFEYLLRAFDDGSDAEARERMSEASVIAGMAFAMPKTTASHACSFPLTNLHHSPHGAACILTLDHFARVNADADDGRLGSSARWALRTRTGWPRK